MKPTNHEWTYHCQNRIDDARSAAAAVLIATENGAHIWRTNLAILDQAIADLQAARKNHADRLLKEAEAIQEQRMQEHLKEKAA